jgi:hypothetical protein
MSTEKSKIISITFTCPVKQEVVTTEEFNFSSHSDECDLCGSHGDIKVNFHCPLCDKYHEDILSEW